MSRHRGVRGHVNEWTTAGTAEPSVAGGGRAEHQTQAATLQSSTSYRLHKVVRQAVKKSGCTIRSMCHAMGLRRSSRQTSSYNLQRQTVQVWQHGHGAVDILAVEV